LGLGVDLQSENGDFILRVLGWSLLFSVVKYAGLGKENLIYEVDFKYIKIAEVVFWH
jgi:hypothetical protein